MLISEKMPLCSLSALQLATVFPKFYTQVGFQLNRCYSESPFSFCVFMGILVRGSQRLCVRLPGKYSQHLGQYPVRGMGLSNVAEFCSSVQPKPSSCHTTRGNQKRGHTEGQENGNLLDEKKKKKKLPAKQEGILLTGPHLTH